MIENTDEKQFCNNIVIVGTVVTNPIFSHDSFDESFYSFYISTERLSGEPDVLPVIVPKLYLKHIEIGARLKIEGQIRTFNEGKHLIINVFAKSCEPTLETVDICNFNAKAYVCKAPIFRNTPNGREITDLLLAINRRFNKSDYLPTITWGRTAYYAKSFKVGEHVAVNGRLQSRTYTKKHLDGSSELLTTYELSVKTIEII